jgi:hypothetical protein
MVQVVAVKGICALWLSVVVLKGVEVMIGPIGGLSEG